MRKPQFNQLRAEMDGFSPCGGRPSEKNVQAFKEFLCRGIDDAREGELDTWDAVLASAYDKLAFFRVYYCAECPSRMPRFFMEYPDPMAGEVPKELRP